MLPCDDETGIDTGPETAPPPQSPSFFSYFLPNSPSRKQNHRKNNSNHYHYHHRDDEHTNTHHHRPQTPPPSQQQSRHSAPQFHHHHQQHSSSSSLPSPLSMSLYHIGIGTPSPFHHRQSSTFSASSPPVTMTTWSSHSPAPSGLCIFDPDEDDKPECSEDEYNRLEEVSLPDDEEIDDTPQDRKDLLVERLGVLMRRLREAGEDEVDGEEVDGEEVEVLLGMVGEMEGVVFKKEGRPKPRPKMLPAMLQRKRRRRSSASSIPPAVFEEEEDRENRQPTTPVRELFGPPLLGIRRLSVSSVWEPSPPLPEVVKAVKTEAPGVSEEVVREAEELNRRLEIVVEKLRKRREETDHIHTLLVDRAEAAAARIVELEKEVADLEDEVAGNESDLRHLRLELRAVETLSHGFLSVDTDPELVQSILNWKSDWAKLRDKMAAKKKSRRAENRPLGGAYEESTILTPSLAEISVLVHRRSPAA